LPSIAIFERREFVGLGVIGKRLRTRSLRSEIGGQKARDERPEAEGRKSGIRKEKIGKNIGETKARR
jgi:hypothetical protein